MLLSYTVYFFFYYSCDHPDLHSFPTRRSSDLSGRRITASSTEKIAVVAPIPTARVTNAISENAGVRRSTRRACGTSRRSEEHTSELQSQSNLVCRLLLEKKKNKHTQKRTHRRT